LPYLKQTTGISNALSDRGYATVFRDENYLQYKTQSLTLTLQIHGCLCWVKIQNGLLVGDMEIDDNKIDLVLKELQEIAVKLNLISVGFQCSKDTPLHEALSKRLVTIPSFPVIYKDLNSGIDANKLRFTFADIDIF
ncbi:MAG TPA: hypothetical protein VKH37_14050, partial [Ferruginibacter sp.]|nr:hypothetical protein [Ferruginibacter sp.]